jgi:hypothetical protein
MLQNLRGLMKFFYKISSSKFTPIHFHSFKGTIIIQSILHLSQVLLSFFELLYFGHFGVG